jgi:hypothetical protein
LITNGANVNREELNDDKWSPLQYAVSRMDAKRSDGHTHIVRLLLNAGARVNFTSKKASCDMNLDVLLRIA